MDDNTKVTEQPELIDIKSYKAANKRVHFKRHIAIYALVMIVLWVLYFFIFRETPQPEAAQTVAEGAEAAAESATANAPAPMGLFLKCTLFVTILWTVILFFHYLFGNSFREVIRDVVISLISDNGFYIVTKGFVFKCLFELVHHSFGVFMHFDFDRIVFDEFNCVKQRVFYVLPFKRDPYVAY